MTQDHRRKQVARFLLAIFIPMLVITSLHHHDDEWGADKQCMECVHHIPHGGHWMAHPFSVDDCLICQFNALFYLLPVLSTAGVYLFIRKTECLTAPFKMVIRQRSCLSLRAPPADYLT